MNTIFLMVGTSRESISAPLFQAACVKLGIQYKFLPYAQGEAPIARGDIVYFRDPFNLGTNATDSQFVASLIAQNQGAVYIDGIAKYKDLFFEDKFVQYERFSAMMPATTILTREDYEDDRHNNSDYIVKERLNAGGKGVFFGDGFSFREDTFLLQEKLRIEHDYRIICVGNTVVPVALKRAAKYDNSSVSKTVGVQQLTPADIAFAKAVLDKVPEYDLVGLDVAIAEGKHYLIEVNRSPQIKIFQARTGIDVASAVIERQLKKISF